MRLRATIMAILLAAALTAGCGTETADSGQAKTIADAESPAGKKTAADAERECNNEEERTEVRREKYDDCDGSGHGYVEIYYSDGSMETEEY